MCRLYTYWFLTAQEMKKHPRKRMYRARAHSNPLNDASFDVPAHPDEYDWRAPIIPEYCSHVTCAV